MSNALMVLDDVERRLAEITSVDEAREIADQAEAFRVYAKSAQRGVEVQNHCAFVKIVAQRRGGELLRCIERAQGDRHGKGLRSVLERSGVPPVTAHRWQIMATVPESTVRKLWTKADAQGTELTSAAIYRVGNALRRGRVDVDDRGQLRTSTEEQYTRLLGSIERCLQLERYAVLPVLHLNYLQHLLAELRFLRDRVDAGIGAVTRQIDVELHDFQSGGHVDVEYFAPTPITLVDDEPPVPA